MRDIVFPSNIGLLLAAFVLLLLPGRLPAAEVPKVTTLADLVREFDQAEVNNALDAHIGEKKSGEVSKPSIFLHPNAEGDATARFTVSLPKVTDRQRIVLIFSIGLADGVKFDDPDHPPNGVIFSVDVDGQRVFSEASTQCRWRQRGIDLTAHAGRTVRVGLNTNAMGNTNYDWALFGGPKVLLLAGNLYRKGEATPAAVGVALFRYRIDGPRGTEAPSLVITTADGRPRGGHQAYYEFPQEHIGDGVEHVGAIEFDLADDPNALERGVVLALPDPPQGFNITLSDVVVSPYRPEPKVVRLGANQAVVAAGGAFQIVCKLKNCGRAPIAPEDGLTVTLALPKGLQVARAEAVVPIQRLAAGAETVTGWPVRTVTDPGEYTIAVAVEGRNIQSSEFTHVLRILPPIPHLPTTVGTKPNIWETDQYLILENSKARIVFVKDGGTIAYALYHVWDTGRWALLATSPWLSRLTYVDDDGNHQRVTFTPTDIQSGASRKQAWVKLRQELKDADGVNWEWKVRCRLPARSNRLLVEHSWRADGTRPVTLLEGPVLFAGDNGNESFGASKDLAIFPGLEFLEDDERSSSTRDAAAPINLRLVPDPYKVTVPLMAVSAHNHLVALMWDQMQRWDGRHFTVSAEFASPNFEDAQENHKMGLFLPAGAEWVKENETSAYRPYPLAAGQPVTLESQIVLDAHADALDAFAHYFSAFGPIKSSPKPRTLAQEMALCRYGFMKTVWDEQAKAWSHCVGWGAADTPGFATLLWFDAQLNRNPDEDEKRRVLERVNLVAGKILGQSGPEGLASSTNCHIMSGELPFYIGHLDGGLRGLERHIRGLMASQQNDGSWRFNPDEHRRVLGKPGDTVIGLCARNARDIMRYARITGDPAAAQSGLKALEFMNRFRVPRGAQTWECPMYEPDILAAAWAVGAYLECYRFTGKREYLDKAVYWAKTGLPFIWVWSDPERPIMQGATVPVFGTTFYTHSWFGVPVQWCGLCYAYNIQQLAAYDSSFPWRDVAEAITVSGMIQQFGDEKPELKGTYPDAVYEKFTRRSPAYINPEDIMLNVLALGGYDPDIKTAIVAAEGARYHISSGAKVADAKLTDSGALKFTLTHFAGVPSYTVITNAPQPVGVAVEGREIPQVQDLTSTPEGWQHDEKTGWTFLKVQHQRETQKVVITHEAPRPE